MKKSLHQLHEDVPANHYDKGFYHNIFQRYWHTKRIKEIKNMLPNSLGKVLDIGCHGGFLTEHLLCDKHYTSLHGIDISEKALAYAKKRLQQGTFITADAHAIPFSKETFDTILCLEMLEHVENPQKVLQEIKKVLKKQGKVYILVPTDTLLFKTIWYVWNMLFPAWKHTHVQSFQGNKLVRIIQQEGYLIEKKKWFLKNMLLLIKAKKKITQKKIS